MTSNHNVRINGNMPFATYDQAFGLPDGQKIQTHELRVLEKEGGRWLTVATSVHEYKPK